MFYSWPAWEHKQARLILLPFVLRACGAGNGRAGPEPPRQGCGNCCGTSAAAAPPPQAQDRLVRPQDLQSFPSFSAWWHLSIWGSGQAHSVRTRDSACSQQREKATANKAIVEESASVPADRF